MDKDSPYARKIELFNAAIAELLATEEKGFKLEKLATKMGMSLVYSDQDKTIHEMLQYNKRMIDKLWAIGYQNTSGYMEDYYDLKPIVENDFPNWVRNNPEMYSTFRSHGLSDDEIRLQEIEARMFEQFLNFCDKQNTHLVIYKGGRYIKPNFEQFQEAIQTTLKRTSQQQLNALKRLREYGMFLPNYDNLQMYITESELMNKAFKAKLPKENLCQLCLMDIGNERSFETVPMLLDHLRVEHKV
jgi:hypothetical protein